MEGSGIGDNSLAIKDNSSDTFTRKTAGGYVQIRIRIDMVE